MVTHLGYLEACFLMLDYNGKLFKGLYIGAPNSTLPQFVYGVVFQLHVFVCALTMCMPGALRGQKSVRFPGTRVTGNFCELPYRC